MAGIPIKIRRRTPTVPVAGNTGDTTSAPMIIVGCGTAQCHRAWSLVERLGEVGTLNRVQSVICYDSNEATKREITTKANRLRQREGALVLQTDFIPQGDGFNRDPYAYLKYEGLVLGDLERIVEEVQEHSDRIGTPPMLVVEFFGFGGHSIIGFELHKMLRRTLPNAHFLPIMLVPRDAVLEDCMCNEFGGNGDQAKRMSTWQALENLAQEEELERGERPNILVTDNGISNDYRDLDHKLAVALAAIEGSAQTGTANSGTLSDIVASFAKYSGGWYGVSVDRRLLPAAKRWSWIPPFRRLTLTKGNANNLAWMARTSIREDILSEKAQLAFHSKPNEQAPQRLVVAVPTDENHIQVVKRDTEGQLYRERFFDTHREWNITFGDMRFPGNYLMESRDSNDADVQKKKSRLSKGLNISVAIIGAIIGIVIALAINNGLVSDGGILPSLADDIPVGAAFFGAVLGALVGIVVIKFLADLVRWLFNLGQDVNELYMYVARFYPLDGRIDSIQNIIDQHHEKGTKFAWNKEETGAGTWWHWQNSTPESEVSQPEEPASSGNGNSGEPRVAASRVVDDSTDGNRWIDQTETGEGDNPTE
ncbi:MAG: hypothetical protein ACE5Q6_14815 [Dehalococcoidia bacterium]